ncbi:MAG: hypothetical protein J6S01_03845, partial [Bacteroidales bacterium]|nr:hypothetical protein [Bacteroidales bacterium]
QYYLRAYVKDGESVAYGEVIPLIIRISPPSLTSVIVSSVGASSALFFSSVTDNGGDDVSEVGFYYNTDEAVDPETSFKLNQPYSEDAFNLQAEELIPNTKYYVKAFAVNSAGTGYSQIVEFTTSAGVPSVSTLGTVEVTSTSAELSGEVSDDNGAEITERGFVWLQGTGTPTTDSFKLKVDGEVGEYSTTLEGLDPNQKYSFRAYAINSKGTAYGEIMTFSTVVGLPVLSTVDVADITATSAIVTADVKDKGGESIAEVGFYYSTEETVDIESSVKVKKNYTGNAFSASLDELQIFADYYVKAYAVNSAGVAYSDVVSFKTLASTPVVNTVGASEITPTSAVLSGTVATDNGAAITERGFVWLKGTDAPTTSSNKVKVEGATGDFTATISGLDPNKKYSFRTYAINSMGTAYGDIMTFNTVAGLPDLSAMKVSSITTTSATFTCTVTNHGGETVSEVGFYYSKEESVDVETAQKISEVYSSDAFTLKAEDLEIGQNYYVKAYVKNSVGETYSAVIAFKTTSTAPLVSTIGYTKLSATSAELSGQVLDDNGENITERGFVWLKGEGTPTTSSSKLTADGTMGAFTATLTDLLPNQVYSFRAYAINSKGTSYGEVMTFEIQVDLPTVTTNEVTNITDYGAVSGGNVTVDGGADILAKGVVWSRSKNPTVDLETKTDEGTGLDSFTSTMSNLTSGSTYYVRAYATNVAGTGYGKEMEFKTTGEAPYVALEAANCFIVSSSETYSFKTVKGNSSESVGDVASAEVLWESFGTSETPSVGSLIASVAAESGSIVFEVADTYREGNAVIAAKDASGKILWSWHIWMTDQPQEHIYPNNAGTMMDRNLGATSATPGDVGALGLLYQWGRKDPFLGSSSISGNSVANSTITWPSAVSSDSSTGTVDYVTSHPTTFVKGGSSQSYDWHYSSRNNTLWQSEKTIYDPCPAGWRVPDGGVWNVAGFSNTTYDDTNKGISFSISSPSTTWYPASGYRFSDDGALSNVGRWGYYWSVAPYSSNADTLGFNYYGDVAPTDSNYRAYGFPVRCLQESE